MTTKEVLSLKTSRHMYIAEAALEYLISILVAGSFLATLTRELGISDSLTGILSSVISLGCLFQLLSVVFRKKRVKTTVIVLSVVNQLLFLTLYLIPLTDFSKSVKTALFVVVVFAAYLVYNFAHPKKINWLMSLVEDRERGIFTANKEIVSLIAGMIFSFVMGAVSDHFAEIGQIRIAFLISAAVMFLVMLMHTLSMVFAVEPETESTPTRELRKSIAEVFQNKQILKIILVFVLYQIATSVTTPFYGTYQINELGFGLKFVSALAICSSVSRILVSKAWGRYADKHSFATMIEKCFAVFAVSTLCVVLATPENGSVFFTLHSISHGIAMGGINSALINMIFDYVPHEKRADSLAICQATSGLVGFLATLCISPLVSQIQANGNRLFGISVYAQQVVAGVGLVFILIAMCYVRTKLIAQRREKYE